MQRIITGDILAFARHYKGPRFHAVLCDPPYHLTSIVKRFGAPNAAPAQYGRDGAFARVSTGFMGQTWDGGDVAFRSDTWAAIASLLYPGAHLLAFGGTRTYHRLACAIEDAGFEIRDMVAWLYGSGFPKSLDVSKAIDKAAGAEREVVAAYQYPDGRRRIDCTQVKGMTLSSGGKAGTPISEPSTDGAKQWEGWGTALKPAWEPIIVARKPLEGTVAENCLRYGTGALNIDASRVGTDSTTVNTYAGRGPFGASQVGNEYVSKQVVGRWPANLIHDGSEEVLAGFPQNIPLSYRKARTTDVPAGATWSLGRTDHQPLGYTDSGSAARFFYTAKADTNEREAGLLGQIACAQYGKPDTVHDPDDGTGLTTRRHHRLGEDGLPIRDKDGDIVYQDCRRNMHPTVKPLSLLQWLATLILPPPLDEPRRILIPFAGVGSEMIGAMQAGWDEIVGVELHRKYTAIAKLRLDYYAGLGIQLSLDLSAERGQPASTQG